MMKIILVNPNSSEAVSGIILRSARKNARPTTELVILTNPSGTEHIDSAFADYMSTHSHVKACLQEIDQLKPDAIVLAGFGNVGIYALKEVLDIPVVSISEASMSIACLLGHKFTTITMLKQFIPYQEDLVRLYGLENRCSSCRAINVNSKNAATDGDQELAELKKEILRVLKEDDADVIILACASFSAYADELSEFVGIPVLDPVVVAVKVAEMMVDAGLSHSKVRKFAFPPQDLNIYY